MADTVETGLPIEKQNEGETTPSAFTSDQLKAVNARDPLVCVAAGAGSGKTTILIERIARLLAEHREQPGRELGLDQIVAITFTEKAAAEMKARLRRKFREAADPAHSGDTHFWRDMERQVDSARVSTIHSFCASILREHALRIGMDPDWAVLGDVESEQMAEQAVVETLYRLLEQEDPACLRLSLEMSRAQLKMTLEGMTAKRWEFQTVPGGERYASPEALYAHWREELPRVQESLLQVFCHNQEVHAHLEALGAYDGQCVNVADKREQQRHACMAVFQALVESKDDLAGRIRTYFADYPRMGGKKDNWPSDAVYDDLKETLTKAKYFLKTKCLLPEWNDTFEQKAAQMTCDLVQVGNQVMDAYREFRQARAALDFEDMINETLKLLRNNPALCRRVAGGIRFLLIDEFQDTDNRQYDIAELLMTADGGPDLFVVGDVKQSIYYFRGAEVDIFNRVRKQSRHPLTLPDNFRSLPDVLQFVNDFFMRTGLLDAVENYESMGVFRKAQNTPCVECFLPQIGEKEAAANMRERDAEFVARRIRELCGGDAPLQLVDEKKGVTRSAKYDDVVLLFRRGSYMNEYEAALREQHIPYNRISGAGFFQRREIQDILALLQLILDPWDEEALVTVLRSPIAGLSDESLMRMAMMRDGLAAVFHSDAYPDAFDQAEVLDNARRLFSELYEQRESEPGHLLRQVLERTGYEAVLLGGYLGLQHAANVRKAIQMADGFTQSRPATLAEFTQYLSDVTFRELKEGESTLQSKGMGAVTLMSIHKAKGLEFPIVFLPEMFAGSRQGGQELVLHHKHFGVAAKATDEDGMFQVGSFFEAMNRFRRHDEKMESARILYVAMTRAKDYLVLCSHPFSPRFSWADTLNRAYELTELQDKAIVTEPKWQMRMIRSLPVITSSPPAKPVTLKLGKDAIARQIRPIGDIVGEGRVFSVTRMVALMTGVTDREGEDDGGQELGDEDTAVPSRTFSMERGTLVHRLFEKWNFTDDIPPDINQLVREAGLGMEYSQTLRNTLLRMVEEFRESDLWSLYAGAAAVDREVPFLLDIGPAILRGVLDAVVDDRVIVDYKTGKPDSTLRAHYTMQLYLYAAAFQTLKGMMPERGILWYADSGQSHDIRFEQAQIQRILAQASQSCMSC